jgi:hypothetical protein
MTISLLPKLAGEIRRYEHDWSAFLGEDTIVSQTNTITGATLDDATIEAGNKSVVFKISGGTDGTVASLAHTITTAAGDEETEIFILPIGAEEPVSLSEARAQVNIIDPADTTYDTFLLSLIPQARAFVERESRFFWVAASRTETFSAWGDGRNCVHWHSSREFLEIYRRPIASIDSVAYGPAGDDTEYTGFVAPLGRFPLRIYPAPDNSFPALNTGEAITVSYTSGALSSTSEEYLLGKRAMLLLIGHWFANREAVVADVRAVSVEVQLAVTSILDSLRPVSAY